MNQFKIGDKVTVRDIYARPQHRGQVYRVAEILRVNIVVIPVNGGRGMRGKPELFELADDQTTSAPTTTTVTSMPCLAPLDLGAVVKVSGPGWNQPADRLYVVLNERTDGKVKIAQLGGAGGKYWPSIPRAMLTVVDPSCIKISD